MISSQFCSTCFAHIILQQPYEDVDIVDPEKEYTCQKRLLVANWAQIYNQGLAAAVYRRPLTQASFQGKAIDWVAKTHSAC